MKILKKLRSNVLISLFLLAMLVWLYLIACRQLANMRSFLNFAKSILPHSAMFNPFLFTRFS